MDLAREAVHDNWQEGVGKENKDRTLVKKEWLDTRAIEEVVIEGVDILDVKVGLVLGWNKANCPLSQR